MVAELLKKAKNGESVFIDEVDRAFQAEPNRIGCAVELAIGGAKQFLIALPEILEADQEQIAFVREYFYASVYNIISTYGGKQMTLRCPASQSFAWELCASLDQVFQVALPKAQRSGYGKCLNVTDRINAALGHPAFRFVVEDAAPEEVRNVPDAAADAVECFRDTVKESRKGRYCGIDIGGTDIKVIGVLDETVRAVREFDWNPALFRTVEELVRPVEILTESIRMALSVPENAPREDLELCTRMLACGTELEEVCRIIAELSTRYSVFALDGIGVSFPDVVIEDMIVGGETLKTKGMREASADYDAEFAKMQTFKERLQMFCTADAPIHMANDGSLAAYTAAVEWAWSPENTWRVPDGVFAHTLGTELGSGWVDEAGKIPQIPLEIYNCVIDLGSYPARTYDPTDVRSVSNFNTGLHGTLQKYTSQYGAYRIALRRFREEAPEEYEKFFTLGYLQEDDNGIFVVTKPKDRRKELLEYLMNLACSGQPQAEDVFREIGACLSVATHVTNSLLEPKVKSRVLFGRFVKKRRVFELMQEGANSHNPVELLAADGGLAFTPQMLELDRHPVYTVAQFGQAVGAMFYANS